jgi:hypothetical protein
MSWNRRGFTIVLAILWALVGPIGMAFDGCAAMGGMCEAPCGLTTPAVGVTPALIAVLNPIGVIVRTAAGRPTGVAKVLDPPPRAVPHSA